MDNSAEELDSLLAQFEEELKAGNIDPDDANAVTSALRQGKVDLWEEALEQVDEQTRREAIEKLADILKQRDQDISQIENRILQDWLHSHRKRGQF